MNIAASNTLPWFAAHEGRLIWRDFVSLMTGGKPQRTALVGTIVLAIIAGMHAFAAYLVRPALETGIVADKATLLMISGAVVMFMSLMFSQSIESVTRAYYARSDLDLILSSPAPSHRLFEVRTTVLALQTIMLSALIAAPLVNVLIYYDGWHWLSAYVVLISMGGAATALAVLMTLALFRLVGTVRTRLIAQIVAAVVGAGFVIALQAVAIIFGQGVSRFSFFTASDSVAASPDVWSLWWLPARAIMGEGDALFIVALASSVLLAGVVGFSARRFARDVLATAGMVERKAAVKPFKGFARRTSIRAGLRRKEWALLKRDPWLMSQSLQQILYLAPPALLLWMNFGNDYGIFLVVVPVIVMAAGQLAGGLAWITISGEDAHELIDTAPVPMRTILLAKIEAVFAIIGVVLAPFAVVLALFSFSVAAWMLLGGALSSASAVMIQLWFRSQANRSLFRRRQVSSRIATLCEALVSILWAAAAALALAGSNLALVPVIVVAVVLCVAWFLKPVRA